LYDPVTDAWSAAGSLTVGRFGHTATLLNSGKVLVAGGSAGGGSLRSAELYDPLANTWSAAGSMTEINGRIGHTATLLSSGKVLAAGGGLGAALTLASAELYDPATNTWSAVANMTGMRSGHTALSLN